MKRAGVALVATLWLGALSAALWALSGHTAAYGARAYDLLARPPLTRLDSRLLDVVTLGHRGLYDDVVAIWMVQTLMDARLAAVRGEDLEKLVLEVSRHRPKIETFYMLACFVVAFDFKRPEACEKLTLDGLQAFPDGWRIPMLQGYIYAYELKDLKSAAVHYGLASSRPGAPEFLKSLTAKLIELRELTSEDLETTRQGLLGKGMKALLEGRRKP